VPHYDDIKIIRMKKIHKKKKGPTKGESILLALQKM
jgi:hypothetical protein